MERSLRFTTWTTFTNCEGTEGQSQVKDCSKPPDPRYPGGLAIPPPRPTFSRPGSLICSRTSVLPGSHHFMGVFRIRPLFGVRRCLSRVKVSR